jgi:hypothetical protein
MGSRWGQSGVEVAVSGSRFGPRVGSPARRGEPRGMSRSGHRVTSGADVNGARRSLCTPTGLPESQRVTGHRERVLADLRLQLIRPPDGSAISTPTHQRGRRR